MSATAPSPLLSTTRSARLWTPKKVLFTADALEENYGQELHARLSDLDIPIEVLPGNRLTGLRGADERETYRLAKSTLAVVKAPPSQFRLQPIPPSADYQFHLAQGCPAHCHYCYLAGSLSGPPVVRVYANLPDILDNLAAYVRPGSTTTFEASCYTDPLGLEHLTGGLSKAIAHFGQLEGAGLRFVSKFAAVEPLLGIDHGGRTRARISLNAEVVARRLEGGTASILERIAALRRLALPQAEGGGGYPIGLVLAPLMPIEGWRDHYGKLLEELGTALAFAPDLTVELITHRFTDNSRDLLQTWYPNTSLDMSEEKRSRKFNKFGGQKYVYDKSTMQELKHFFYGEIGRLLPQAEILYWT